MTGQTISHYDILEKLGEGGMGLVYKARDSRLDRLVAIKVLPPEAIVHPERRRRFVQEARAASALNHPNIITIYDIEQLDGGDFIAMEYVRGVTLAELIAHEPISLRLAVRYTVQIADALEAAHRVGIVHRDLKPANVMLTESGLVKVLDFGLAKLNEPSSSDSATAVTATQVGVVMGTVAYMSPEQAEGRPLDGRSDIFSLGAVLYEMLTGRRAFGRSSTVATLAAVLRDEPQPLADAVKDAPPELSQLLHRCLRKDPAARFQSMTDVKLYAEDLLAHIGSSQSVSVRREPVQEEKSIAVLPFADMSPQKDQEYFCDGIADEILNALAHLPCVRVASRTSAFQFKGRTDDIRKIGAQLNVTAVLEGSVRKAGERLRISAQLINVADGYQLWSERFDREMKDVFEIQDEISLAIVDKLKIQLAPGTACQIGRHPTDDPEAYQLYLKAKFYWNQWTTEGVQAGIGFCEQAIARDPHYALAYSGLADCYTVLGGLGYIAPSQCYPKAREAARRALELDPALAEAHASLGIALCFSEWNWPEAEKHFQRAIQINPIMAGAYHAYGLGCLTPQLRLDEAYTIVSRGAELDPHSIAIALAVGSVETFRGDLDRAIQRFDALKQMAPGFYLASLHAASAYAMKGDIAAAIADLKHAQELSNTDPRVVASLGHYYGLAGDANEARNCITQLEEMAKVRYMQRVNYGIVRLGLGEIDGAFSDIEQSVEAHDGWVAFLQIDRKFAALRQHPRYRELLARMGLDAHQSTTEPSSAS